MSEPSLLQRLQQLVSQIQEVEQGRDPEERGHLRDLVQTVLDLHGAALAQLLELIAREGELGQKLLERATQDQLVRNLLLLHGLHPLDLETRTCEALDQVRPFLHSQGAEVEILAVAEGAVRMRLHRSPGYPASLQTLRAAIEEAIGVCAPDVRLIDFVEPEDEGSRATSRFPLPLLIVQERK